MAFSAVVMVANFVGLKPLAIAGFIISAGSILFPLTYLMTTLTAEVFGRKSANSIIKMGLLCNIFAALFVYKTISFPYPPFWDKQAHYEVIMEQTWRIFVLSSFAYILSEYANLIIFSYITRRLKGGYFHLRVFISTLSAVIIDTLMLVPIMIHSSPTVMVVIRKILSLIIFKSCFILFGLMFISLIRDYLVQNERNKNSGSTDVDMVSDILEPMTYKARPQSNVYWYKFKR